MIDAERVPVIAGIGEVVDRSPDPSASLDAVGLMAAALDAADSDASGLLARLDSLDVVHQTSWSYPGTVAALAARAGISPRRGVYGVTGGESPVRYIHEAASRIAAGGSAVAAVVGAEAQYARARARKTGVRLAWPERAPTIENALDPAALYNPLALKYRLLTPAEIYPLYENAAPPEWGQTPEDALIESGIVWANMAMVAAANPFAWDRSSPTAAAITTPGDTNRLVAWPYTKRMVANPQVNQGAAVIVASLAEARRAALPDERLIHILGGAHAMESRDFLIRPDYRRSTAQEAVLRAATRIAAGDIDLVELYSCFPIVPKMARRTLGLDAAAALTVTGGLSFFGAPLNNYMSHAACAMVRALRAGSGRIGLLYGQGEFVTKHHALLLSREAGEQPPPAIDLVREVAAVRRPAPSLRPDHDGAATLETFTVSFGRDGAPSGGTVLARTPRGDRAIARIAPDDAPACERLLARDRSPVGAGGRIVPGDIACWRFV